MSTSENQAVDTAPKDPPFLIELAVFVAAVIGRMPTMGAWWNMDDWGQLGRAAGLSRLASDNGFPARWLSQHFWWDLTWPLFGMNADAHSLARLCFHALSAVLVTRIATHAGLGRLPRLLAGLIFAASPLAFTPLYWASGIQEILGTFFALLAVERWLAAGTAEKGSRQDLLVACLAAICSMLSKEAGIGLPLLFLAMMWLGIGVRLENKAFAWGMVMIMMMAAVAEGVLVLNHFAADQTGSYALGDLQRGLLNLGVYGWWLMSPGPIFASQLYWVRIVPGFLLFAAWLAWGILQWRRGNRLALLSLVAALLSLAPALVLKERFVPYLAYLAGAAGSLALVSLLPSRWTPRYPVLVVLTIAATAWGFTGMRIRLANRDDMGLVADPVARATSLSWEACRTLTGLTQASRGGKITHLTIFQQPVSATSAAQAERLGERWVDPTELYNALHGTVGPEMVLASDINFTWVSGLVTNPPEALVLCDTGTGLRIWGPTWNALLYAALTDIGLGHFERARRHLVRAAALNDEMMMFIFDEGQMIIPLDMVMKNKEWFVDWTVGLLGNGGSPHEVGGIQEMFFNLLSSCTGRSVSDLATGSHLISGSEPEPNLGSDAAADTTTEGE